jgi:hypothetical protein
MMRVHLREPYAGYSSRSDNKRVEQMDADIAVSVAVVPVRIQEEARVPEMTCSFSERRDGFRNLEHGVVVVRLLLPPLREVVVLTTRTETRHGIGASLPPHPALPGLTPAVADLFWQIARPG